MKKWIAIGALPVLAVGSWLFVVLFTAYPIERYENGGQSGVSIVGQEFSHYNVEYIDSRDEVERNDHYGATLWRGMGREWRQAGRVSYTRDHWYTDHVLRDVAFKEARFGVSRGSQYSEVLQKRYEEVVSAYVNQTVFDRVWIWRVQEFH